MVLADAPKAPTRDREESFRFEKLPGRTEDGPNESTLWQSMIEWKDFHLFLFCSCGLVALNGFIAVYFTLHEAYY